MVVGEDSYLEADMSIKCYHNEHLLYVALAVGFGILYIIGVPFISVYILWTNRRMLHSPDISDEYGSLYLQYENNFYFWEVLVSIFRHRLPKNATTL